MIVTWSKNKETSVKVWIWYLLHINHIQWVISWEDQLSIHITIFKGSLQPLKTLAYYGICHSCYCCILNISCLLLVLQTSTPLKRSYGQTLSHVESPIHVPDQMALECGDGSVKVNEDIPEKNASFQERCFILH